MTRADLPLSDASRTEPFAAIKATLGGPHAFNRVVNIDPGLGFVYLENPKVACSTIKATLNLAVAARDGAPFCYENMDQIHDRAANPMLKPQALGPARFNALMTDRDVVRFTYVRDPVKRVCSAYLAKIGTRAMRSKIARRFAEALGRDPANPMSLEEFVDLVSQDVRWRDFDPHWRLQRSQIAYDAVEYGYIGRQDRFGETFPPLLKRLFAGQDVTPFDSRREFGRHTASEALSSELTPELRARIETAYAPDIDMMARVDAQFG